MSSVKRLPQRMLSYYLPLGVVWGCSVVAVAALPLSQFALVSFCLAVATVVGSRLAKGHGMLPRGRVANWHGAIAGVVYVGALALAATLARGELIWLSWITAVIVCAACAAGALIVDVPNGETVVD